LSLNGLLLIDKPQDWTSHDVVAKIRRLLKLSSVGHSGTLDPFASGLMVILLGHGTKISDYILSQDKTYEVEVRLGLETDTLDRTGTVVAEKEVKIDRSRLDAALAVCQGEVELEVPLFSAVKIKGKKLYDYARKGQDIVAPRKSMRFYDLKLLEFDGRDRLKVKLSCSKGSYIRSWALWLGRELGCGAVAQELRRTFTQPFSVTQAISLGQLEALVQDQGESLKKDQLKDAYIPLAEALPEVKKLRIASRDERLLMNGQISHDLAARLIADQKEAHQRQENLPIQVLSASSGQLLALLEAQPGKGLKIRRIFKPLA
jgi:tRNA pseudouridine55 synthase